MTKTIKYFEFLIQTIIVLFFLAFPILAFAQTPIAYECINGTVYGNCSFGDLVIATQRITKWLVFFTLQFSVVVIIYAGFNYLISGDKPAKRAEANRMLSMVAIGIFFVMAAWLIVNLISTTLLTADIQSVTPVGS